MRFLAPVGMEESLGNILRSAREASAITVDDAVYRAKLPRAVVEALEVGDIGGFASPLYARSFLKQYGEYVGVDVSQWIDESRAHNPDRLRDGRESFIDLSDSTTPPATREKGKEKTKSSGGA